MASGSPNISDLLNSVPIGDIASSFGVDEATAKQAVEQTLPGLLGGMAVNASNTDGAEKLTAALKKHEGAPVATLKGVDTNDGEKIVKHVLGDKQDAVAQALSQQSGGGIGDLIPKLLPILAPIVMGYLANKMSGSSSASSSSSNADGGGIGDLLGGLLGGGSSSNSGGGLGDLLGGLLGGDSKSGSGGGLGGLLGGLLGGK
ncbi:MAG: DUF937 domain-containing protein [Leucobacter sp.]|nr:DUF937 domain-containing protein [Leucobacter sp.]